MTDTKLKFKAGRPTSLLPVPTHYCPGCGHGIVHRLLAEAIAERGIRERTIGLAPVGCAVIAYDYLDIDMSEAPHGRTPAVATGIKRSLPDRIVHQPGKRLLGMGGLYPQGMVQVRLEIDRGTGRVVFHGSSPPGRSIASWRQSIKTP